MSCGEAVYRMECMDSLLDSTREVLEEEFLDVGIINAGRVWLGSVLWSDLANVKSARQRSE